MSGSTDRLAPDAPGPTVRTGWLAPGGSVVRIGRVEAQGSRVAGGAPRSRAGRDLRREPRDILSRLEAGVNLPLDPRCGLFASGRHATATFAREEDGPIMAWPGGGRSPFSSARMRLRKSG